MPAEEQAFQVEQPEEEVIPQPPAEAAIETFSMPDTPTNAQTPSSYLRQVTKSWHWSWAGNIMRW